MSAAEAVHPEQQRAAEPAASVWVAASAGSGKTKVLTDRLLRLMLDGAEPARTLCLTFTRAAAAEMANRLNRTLAEWATLPDGKLAAALCALTGHRPDDEMLAAARQLFARVLDTPGGIKIATIHAFCQTLLRRFPLEAGVAPEFAVVEERSAQEALVEAGEAVIAAAREQGGDLAQALKTVARHVTEERFSDLMMQLAADQARLRRVIDEGELDAELRALLQAPTSDPPHALLERFCAEGAGDIEALRAAAAALAGGSRNYRARAEIITRWCSQPAARPTMIGAYMRAFLNDKHRILKSLCPKGIEGSANVPVDSVLAAEAARVKAFRDAHAAAIVIEATSALARCGGALIDRYEERKRDRGLLDYDDLIRRALALLRDPGRAPWVMFKLDGGLDHILIDEAQDTNPEQWRIAAALCEEFFAGDGARASDRTIFAVGDVKQSIFSFQGADPREFLRMRRHFEERVNAVNRPWHVVPLAVSFRSTDPVLRAVDAIFAGADAQDGVALDGVSIRHIANRIGHAGLVELWPPVAPQKDEEDDAALPVARRRLDVPRARLATAIAATIRRWLDDGEMLPARGRPIRPGDIMVLVRRRNQFVGELLRALKKRDIPVAGADRLILTQQMAVADLMALGRFLLNPADDLTLATVLKGPLFDIDEDTLFGLAHDRGRTTLWQRLRERAAEDARLGPVAERLDRLFARVDFMPPYEFYADLLGAGGGRRAFARRLGPEAEDPVEEFLGAALAYEREHPPSLQGFLRWLEAGETDVKRDFAARQRDEVRVLTVHGAKGLEAPVVFVPDTMALPKPPEALLWTAERELPLWRPRAEFDVPAYAEERQALRRRQLQEYRRLLYVALTRAEDRLYICGWQTKQKPSDLCWHALCRQGLAGIAAPFAFDATALIGQDGWRGEGLRLECAQSAAPLGKTETTAARPPEALPDWVHDPPPPEPDPPRPLFPSRPEGEEPAVMSPLALGGRDRFQRGLLVHRLLQILPELPAAARGAAAARFLASPANRLDPDERDDIRRETLAVLEHPDFTALFGPGSQAEAPLVGLVNGRAVSGQIDRLVVTDERVLIVDYKTLRPPPASESDVAPVYLRQLAIYRAALARLYPGREIRCALLWTEGPRLMPVSPERLAAYLP
jgi:ATP-dependent helicase/nuclease subunit A